MAFIRSSSILGTQMAVPQRQAMQQRTLQLPVRSKIEASSQTGSGTRRALIAGGSAGIITSLSTSMFANYVKATEQQEGAGKGLESIFISAAEVPWQNVDDKGLQAKAFRNDPFRCVFRVPKGYPEDPEFHPVGHEFLIISGKTKMMDLTDGKSLTAGPGDYIYIPAYHKHKVEMLEDTVGYFGVEGTFEDLKAASLTKISTVGPE